MSTQITAAALVISTGALLVGGCEKQPPSPAPTVKVPSYPFTPEQRQRRENTRRIVEAENIPFNRNLPGVETASDVKLRTVDEIARRAIGLTVIAAFAHGITKQDLENRLKPVDIRSVLSPEELAFYDAESPTDEQRREFSWCIEGAEVLLWASGLRNPELSRPDKQCDVPAIYALICESKLDGLLASAKPRPASEILDALDLHYCCHWAIVDEMQIHARPAPGGLDPGVSYQRLRALNWLVKYADDWDDVTTDT